MPFPDSPDRLSPSGPFLPLGVSGLPAAYGGLSYNSEDGVLVVIAAANAFVTVLGPWAAYPELVDFVPLPALGQLRYDGATARPCRLFGGVTMQPVVGADRLGVAIFRNGVLVPSSESQEDVLAVFGNNDTDYIVSSVPIVLQPADLLTLRVVNRSSSTNIRIVHARLEATSLGASTA